MGVVGRRYLVSHRKPRRRCEGFTGGVAIVRAQWQRGAGCTVHCPDCGRTALSSVWPWGMDCTCSAVLTPVEIIGGPRNVLVQLADGRLVVRPFRGMTRWPR